MSLLDPLSVHEGMIHSQMVNGEYGIKEEWWSKYRARKDNKLKLAIGAVPEPEPVLFPEMPRLALGKSAAKPVSETFGKTSTQREFDEASASSELRDWMRETGYFAKRPFHKKGMPAYYGRSLHSSSADGTDFSSRRG
eukprot:CAMPEP_0115847362 /NCGR_PEP_ID=MMETSP0287-20121206/10343_1 /TAXON_ID=412157 /ORGANISM="Chrysochromulina rotalis, Strain UIO044" /LENGTH=137 /DNA_ID=CAMNT_0003301193 /DNA_START=58 /DNA_END=471 /DNA_ORIENTATION=+